MKLRSTDCTIYTMPGTGMEIIVFINMNERSSMQFQPY
jgi:hypothetical protein